MATGVRGIFFSALVTVFVLSSIAPVQAGDPAVTGVVVDKMEHGIKIQVQGEGAPRELRYRWVQDERGRWQPDPGARKALECVAKGDTISLVLQEGKREGVTFISKVVANAAEDKESQKKEEEEKKLETKEEKEQEKSERQKRKEEIKSIV